MTYQQPIEISYHQKFLKEKLNRIINQCDDIDLLREIAIELLKLSQQKTAVAQLATKLAWEAEQSKFSQNPDKK